MGEDGAHARCSRAEVEAHGHYKFSRWSWWPGDRFRAKPLPRWWAGRPQWLPQVSLTGHTTTHRY